MGRSKKDKDKKWTDEDLRIAESLYMDYVTPTAIAKETGIPRTTLVYHIQTYWKPKRLEHTTELMQTVSAARREDFSLLTGSALKIMNRALKTVTTRKTPPTLKEALDAAKVLDTIDRITRLDQAAENENSSSNDQVSSKELIKRLQTADPFFEIEEKESKDEDKSVN